MQINLTWISAVLKSLNHVKNIYWITCSSNYSHFLSRKSLIMQIIKCCFWKMSVGQPVGRMCASPLTLNRTLMRRTRSTSPYTVRACSSAGPVPWRMLGRWRQLLSSWWLTPFFYFLRSGSNCGDTKGEGSEPGGRSPLNLQCLVFFTHIDSMV